MLASRNANAAPVTGSTSLLTRDVVRHAMKSFQEDDCFEELLGGLGDTTEFDPENDEHKQLFMKGLDGACDTFEQPGLNTEPLDREYLENLTAGTKAVLAFFHAVKYSIPGCDGCIMVLEQRLKDIDEALENPYKSKEDGSDIFFFPDVDMGTIKEHAHGLTDDEDEDEDFVAEHAGSFTDDEDEDEEDEPPAAKRAKRD